MKRSLLVAGAIVAGAMSAAGCVQTADSSDLDMASDAAQPTESTTGSSTTLSTPPSTTVIAPAVAAAHARQTFLDAANAVCADMNAQTQSVGGTIADPSSSFAEVADAMDFVIGVTSAAIVELRALPQPPGDEQQLAAMYDQVDALVVTARELEQAVRRGDLNEVRAVRTRLQGEQANVNSAFNAYGLIECGRS